MHDLDTRVPTTCYPWDDEACANAPEFVVHLRDLSIHGADECTDIPVCYAHAMQTLSFHAGENPDASVWMTCS